MPQASQLASLVSRIQSCQLCAEHLPLGPNPIVRASTTAKILIIGQAPGTKVHHTSIPWNDASGNRLRDWMQVDKQTFYDEDKIAIMPMGFCYPGKGKSGDLPPRQECAATWHAPMLALMPNIDLILLIGMYSQKYYLPANKKKTLTATVQAWQEYAPLYLPMPHPSPRNQLWLKKNPWFENEVVKALRHRVHNLIG
jgi:uracil-DNA glycosylase